MKDRVKNESAFFYFIAAADADHGNAAGKVKTGEFYEMGRVVEQDHNIALKYYLEATNQGHTLVRERMDAMCKKGLGVKNNYPQALAFYQKIAENDEAAKEILKRIQLLK